jgi:hypothetical protein
METYTAQQRNIRSTMMISAGVYEPEWPAYIGKTGFFSPYSAANRQLRQIENKIRWGGLAVPAPPPLNGFVMKVPHFLCIICVKCSYEIPRLSDFHVGFESF